MTTLFSDILLSQARNLGLSVLSENTSAFKLSKEDEVMATEFVVNTTVLTKLPWLAEVVPNEEETVATSKNLNH